MIFILFVRTSSLLACERTEPIASDSVPIADLIPERKLFVSVVEILEEADMEVFSFSKKTLSSAFPAYFCSSPDMNDITSFEVSLSTCFTDVVDVELLLSVLEAAPLISVEAAPLLSVEAAPLLSVEAASLLSALPFTEVSPLREDEPEGLPVGLPLGLPEVAPVVSEYVLPPPLWLEDPELVFLVSEEAVPLLSELDSLVLEALPFTEVSPLTEVESLGLPVGLPLGLPEPDPPVVSW